MYYCTLYRSKIKKPTSQKPNLKEGWLHSNTLKETFPLQIECAKKEKAEEKLGIKTKGGGWTGKKAEINHEGPDRNRQYCLSELLLYSRLPLWSYSGGAEFIPF